MIILTKSSYHIVAQHLYRDVYISSKGFDSLFRGLLKVKPVKRKEKDAKWTIEETLAIAQAGNTDRKSSIARLKTLIARWDVETHETKTGTTREIEQGEVTDVETADEKYDCQPCYRSGECGLKALPDVSSTRLWL